MRPEQQLFDEHETARITGRAVQTLRNDRHKRRGLPYVKFGRSVRYIVADIESYIENHRISFDERGKS